MARAELSPVLQRPIAETVLPPSGATAMIAATQADNTALGWYYIPVVKLFAALTMGVALMTNNVQRGSHFLFYIVANQAHNVVLCLVVSALNRFILQIPASS